VQSIPKLLASLWKIERFQPVNDFPATRQKHLSPVLWVVPICLSLHITHAGTSIPKTNLIAYPGWNYH
jgi:hypothetical protein